MVPILTKMAVERKCQFEHVILLGNYELAYSVGVLSKHFGIAKRDDFEKVDKLRDEVIAEIGDRTSDSVEINRLLRVVKEMDTFTDDKDEQMIELYHMGME